MIEQEPLPEASSTSHQPLPLEEEKLQQLHKHFAQAQHPKEILDALFEFLRPSLGCDHVFALEQKDEQNLHLVATTSLQFAEGTWKISKLFGSALRGRLRALFDIEQIAEWQEQPSSVRQGICSALYLPLLDTDPPLLLVCTHNQQGHFGKQHQQQGQRLVSVAAKAINRLQEERRSQEREHFFLCAADLFAIFDRRGILLQHNPSWEQQLGFSPQELQSRPLWDLLSPPPAQEEARQRFLRLFSAEEPPPSTFEMRALNQQEELRWLHWSVTPGPNKNLFYAIVRDITEERRSSHNLLEEKIRYSLGVEGARLGLWDWNIQTNQLYVTPRWKAMLGFAQEEIADSAHEWFSRLHAEDIERFKTELTQHLQGKSNHFQSEYRMLCKDGTYKWLLCRGLALRDAQGQAYRMAGSHSDISARKDIEERLLRDAHYDRLTGLANRVLFLERLQEALKQAGTAQGSFAVLVLDLDRFKNINDSWGHRLGDQLLISIARSLEKYITSGDVVARLGGDAFGMLLSQVHDEEAAVRVAKRLLLGLSQPFKLGKYEVYASVSIGIVLRSPEHLASEDLLRDADNAMYHAKERGRACSAVFDREMRHRVAHRLHLENDLRRALKRERLHLHYQPIVSLDTRHLNGFEALVRWKHPQHGMIPPLQFIPEAEKTGLIIPLGWWVLREACRQFAQWHQLYPTCPPIRVSVNLSGRQFSQPDMIHQIHSILEETAFDPRSLTLEITESMVMENPDQVAQILRTLKEKKIRFYMDDFGTGYSSLSYLPRFPLDALKIDRSFVQDIEENSENLEIIRTIVLLAHNLNMSVVAEGIEREEHCQILRDLGCEFGQGYLFSRPLAAEEATRLIEKGEPL